MAAEFIHKSVLYDETIQALAIKPDGCYVDGTTGGGGHSAGILAALGVGGRLYCLDRDQDALQAARGRLQQVGSAGRFVLCHSVYSIFDRFLQEQGETGVDGILLDLGVSSWQLDQKERGFSYRFEGPLDMRMDQSQGTTAADLLADIDERELSRIFSVYGEEHNARRIARALLQYRDETGPIRDTMQLAELIAAAQPARSRREKGHPAKRCFQALRIAVNGELDELETFFAKAPDFLKPGGRLAIISFHSLEDRLVKQAFRRWESPCECPTGLPCVCGKISLGRAYPRNGILPSQAELDEFPRSHSARLRVFIRADKVQ